MEILIKNMVCNHCVDAVKRVFDSLDLPTDDISLGKAVIAGTPDKTTLHKLDQLLEENGFSRIRDNEEALVEKAKMAILHHIREEEDCRYNLSDCIDSHLGVNYDTVSRIFSAREGRTIEKYHIAQKIEWVKELLNYGELTLSEIAYKTGYSSVAHLSRQFKSVTGLTPTEYMRSSRERKSISEV